MFLMGFGATAVVFELLDAWLGLSRSAITQIGFPLTGITLGAAVAFWLRRIRKVRLSVFTGPRNLWSEALLGAVVGIGALLAGAMATAAVLAVAKTVLGHEVTSSRSQVPVGVHGTGWLVVGFALVLTAPIGEELFFRGFLYGKLRARFAPWSAAMISATLFAGAHVYPLKFPGIFVVGMVFASIYEARRTLVTSMAAHATNNLIVFIVILASHR